MIRGAACGLGAAVLFGLSAPVAKLLLPESGPLLLAGLLYLGAGLGLGLFHLLGRLQQRPRAQRREAPVRATDLGLVAGIVLSGGVLGPVLMLIGLQRVSAASGALLLNLEAPFTIFLAVVVFREHLGRLEALGALAIVLGAAVLSLRPSELRADLTGVLALAGACLSWALDNNLTQRLSLRDPLAVTRIKTLGAGSCTLLLALLLGQRLPSVRILAPALLVGFFSYGVSLVLDTYALRLLGAAREAALFATAPFVGAFAAVPLLGERLGAAQIGTMVLMGAGVTLLLRARHGHVHTHAELVHEHAHVHDEHHQHEHGPGDPPGEPHAHRHRHAALTHDHPHTSDLHHRHRHS